MSDYRIKSTTDYFKCNDDALLFDGKCGLTVEECKLKNKGRYVTYFDDLEEFESEKENFDKWIRERNFEVKLIVETVNHRIAVCYD